MVLTKEEKSTLDDQLAVERERLRQTKPVEKDQGGAVTAEKATQSALVRAAVLLSSSTHFRKNLTSIGDTLMQILNQRWMAEQPGEEHLALRDELLNTLQGQLTIVNAQPNMRKGLLDVLEALVEYASYVTNVDIGEDRALIEKAQTDAKKLLARNTQQPTVEGLLYDLKTVIEDMVGDVSACAYLFSLKLFVQDSLNMPDMLASETWRREACTRLESGRPQLDRHRMQLTSSLERVLIWLRDFPAPVKADAPRTFAELTAVPGLDVNLLKPGMWTPLCKILGPCVYDMVSYIHVPLLELEQESLDLMMAHLVMADSEMRPSQVFVYNRSKIINTFNQALPPIVTEINEIQISASGMRSQLSNVFLAYNHKSFPKVSDVVSFDADIGPAGIAIEIVLAASASPEHVFDVKSVEAIIDSLTLRNIEGVDHGHFLYSIFKPLLEVEVRSDLANAVCQAIREKLMALDMALVDLKDRIVFA